MSEFESDVDVSAAVESVPERKTVLTFFQRLLLAVNLWLAVVAVLSVAFSILLVGLTEDSLRLWLLGFVLLLGAWNAGHGLWKFLNRGRFRAGMALMFFFLFNVVVGSIVALTGLEAESNNRTFVEHVRTSLQKAGKADDEQLLKSEAHLVYGIQSVGGPGSAQTGLQTCIEELHRSAGRPQSMRDEAFTILKVGVEEALAEDALQDVILKVCLRFEEGKVQVLQPYFFKSVNHKRVDLRKRQIRDRTRYCELDENKNYKSWQDPSISVEEQLQLLQAAMCRINSRQAYVVRQRMDKTDYGTIARELDISEDYARKLYSLGLQSLKVEIEILSR